MYSYIFDKETGGILLTPEHSKMSKEPRPVYYKELDLLGFDNYFDYEKNDEKPYMIAEMTNYYYRGVHVASTKGGNIYEAPTLIITEEGKEIKEKLKFIDINLMVKKNDDILEPFINETIKKVYNTYIKYKNKVDVFYVAFSGGKDSIVCLDIVKRALPYNEFKVLFGDTGMEFPDTYDVVDKVEKECKELGIEFYRASSHLTPSESWDIFGPPATVNRWCCSVHKTAPQVLKLREIIKKNDFTGMAFIGVRADESISRSEYEYISLGEKHKGQYSTNPLLKWGSAELYLYIYKNNIIFNETYKKGNRRAGCLVCPRAAERNAYVTKCLYNKEFLNFENNIIKHFGKTIKQEKMKEFMIHEGWKARKNGRDLDLNVNYKEIKEKDYNIILIDKPKQDWKEWIKTIGIIIENNNDDYTIKYQGLKYKFNVKENDNTLRVIFDKSYDKTDFAKYFKNVFKKTSSCIGCRVCEADCHNGNLSFNNGKVKVSDDCIKCLQCHKVDNGCLIYDSLRLPMGGIKMNKIKSLNTYSHFSPLDDWLIDFHNKNVSFKDDNQLGTNMIKNFLSFLRHAEIMDKKNTLTKFGIFFCNKEYTENVIWALSMNNAVYNSSQLMWVVEKLKYNNVYTKNNLNNLLIQDGADEKWVGDVLKSLERFSNLLYRNIGFLTKNSDEEEIYFVRCKWENPIPEVILYSLYKYAEHCGDYDEKTNTCTSLFSEFTLSRLYDEELEQEGISPYKIFGVEKEDMKAIINGLSVKYPDYINCSFTFDLDNINLNKEMRSNNVLDMIMGE